MKSYTYSEARQKLSEILDFARSEEVIIKRRCGESFIIRYKNFQKSPFDIAGIRTKATTGDILDAVRESRSGELNIQPRKINSQEQIYQDR